MNFHKLEKISLRRETIKYFNNFINFNKYNLYYGIIKDFHGIVLYTDDFESNIDFKDNITSIKFDNITSIKFDNNELPFNLDVINEFCKKIETSHDKPIELLSSNCYIKFPISSDLIEWLKAEIEIITETKEIYKKISLPYINSIYDKNTKWIHDLVYNNAEEESVLFRTNDMVICKDIVWKHIDISQFYLLCIPLKKIKSIRNLTHLDIPLLQSMKQNAINIANKYGISENRLYMFFHYHPSYYHLHLHVCITEHESLETTHYRHYYLDDIINKLENDSNYWKKATLKFELLSNTKLFKLLKV